MPKFYVQGPIIFDELGETIAHVKTNKDAEKIAGILTHFEALFQAATEALEFCQNERRVQPLLYGPPLEKLNNRERELVSLINEMDKHNA